MFLPAVIAGFYIIQKLHPKHILIYLLLVSVGFYGYWDWRFAILLSLLTFFNGSLGNQLKKTPSNAKLFVGIALNLGVLMYFKYWNFFLNSIHLSDTISTSVVVPLAISFFTFQNIAYLVDCNRGKVFGTNLEYATFIWFFPQLIAGPVVHYATVFPQFRRISRVHLTLNILTGLSFFTIGLFKKTVIADSLALYASRYASDVYFGMDPTLLVAWCGSLFYTFQIYFDFSGYSDMAMGLAIIFGIRLPINFWSPYKATSVIEFWRRWHITLSTFLKEYLYIPLGGNRQGKYRQFINLFITMILGGLWHGAGWGFIIWGGLHGIFLIINHLIRMVPIVRNLLLQRIVKILGWMSTFTCVVFAWTFFQAATLEQGCDMALALLGAHGIALPGFVISFLGPVGDWMIANGVQISAIAIYGRESIVLLIVAAVIALRLPNSFQVLVLNSFSPRPVDDFSKIVLRSHLLHKGYGIKIGFCMLIGIIFMHQQSPFIYFNF